MHCSSCQTVLTPESKFCHQCGTKVGVNRHISGATGREEHKLITIVFSDVTGYTSMSEILDPEEVKKILSDIFSVINRVTSKNEGRIHERIGDCAVLVFGDPKAREDDALRALRTVAEIHESVSSLSTPQLEARLGRQLSLHSGVNTGKVLVGKEELRGNVQILGDSVNTAARLDSIAGPDEIIVSKSTYQLCRSEFEFEALNAQQLKGKSQLQDVYRFLGTKESGGFTAARRANLIGRQHQMKQLDDSLSGLQTGQASLVTIHAEAGGGKSRFIEEWVDSHAENYHVILPVNTRAISQKQSYSLWNDFLRTYWKIDENANDSEVRDRISQALQQINQLSAAPFIGWLLGLRYEELDSVDATFIKDRIFDYTMQLTRHVAKTGKTIFLFEDLHWADSSSQELLKHIIEHMDTPSMIVCTYRPHYQLYRKPLENPRNIFQHIDIDLPALTKADIELMLQSLLQTTRVPKPLIDYVRDKISGNPFYIEEFVNDLIESGKLVKNGKWNLTADLMGSDIPHTIEGVIRSRIDRLEEDTKNLIQQASVIGRSFYHDILKKMSDSKSGIDQHINTLQESDIIREQQRDPQIEYIFKHALLQEVAYQSLLKGDRRTIHQRAGEVIEDTFGNRLSDFYEILAYHFSRANLNPKAIEYLILAGKKSQRALAAREADQYFQEAYDRLQSIEKWSKETESTFLHLMIEWGFAFYHLGKFATEATLLTKHVELADKCRDLSIKAWYYGWRYTAELFQMKRGDLTDQHIETAIQLAEDSGDVEVMAYCYSWASTGCIIIGNTEKGEKYGRLAVDLSRKFPDAHYLIGKSRFALAGCLSFNGKILSSMKVSQECMELGERINSPRIYAMGHLALGQVLQLIHEHDAAIKHLGIAASESPDPLYTNLSYGLQALSLSFDDPLQQMENVLLPVDDFLRDGELPMLENIIGMARANAMVARGDIKVGLNEVFASINLCKEEHFPSLRIRYTDALCRKLLDILEGVDRPDLRSILRNLKFTVSFLLDLDKNIKKYCNDMIDVAKTNHFAYHHAKAQYYLGRYYLHRKKKSKAHEFLSAAQNEMAALEMPDELGQVEELLQSYNG